MLGTFKYALLSPVVRVYLFSSNSKTAVIIQSGGRIIQIRCCNFYLGGRDAVEAYYHQCQLILTSSVYKEKRTDHKTMSFLRI